MNSCTAEHQQLNSFIHPHLVRLSNNILLHEKTGEVVHIDFGIVFESGKVSVI